MAQDDDMAAGAPVTAALVMTRHRVFRAVLHALAEPGVPRVVVPGRSTTATATAIYGGIWESTTRVHTALDLPPLPGVAVGAEEASVVWLGGADAATMSSVAIGTELAPEQGAMVMVAGGPQAIPVQVSGPGVPGTREVSLPLSHDLLAARDTRCATPPCGADLLVIDGDTVIGLPRTSRLQFAG